MCAYMHLWYFQGESLACPRAEGGPLVRAKSPGPWIPSLVNIMVKPPHLAEGSHTFRDVTTLRTWFLTYTTSEIIRRISPYKNEACLNVKPLGYPDPSPGLKLIPSSER